LWAVTWPDRHQVVRFTERARAETVLEFDSEIDSLAFGQPGTQLDGLMLISHNTGPIAADGTVNLESDLTMVDMATLQTVVIARGGTRGDVVITTSDGRILLSQSEQVDVINPLLQPMVVATNPPPDGLVPLPLPFMTVTFDQDMYLGTASDDASVLNPGNYELVGTATGPAAVQAVVYDATTRTVLISFADLPADRFTLTIRETVSSQLGQTLESDYVTEFLAVDDLSAFVEIEFTTARSDRANETVSYDVRVTNVGDATIVLPVLLTLDPALNYPGVPTEAVGQTEDGKWLVDLSQGLEDGVSLPVGRSTLGRTLTIDNLNDRRVSFTPGFSAQTEPNHAPVFETSPVTEAIVGEQYLYDVNASDQDGHALFYYLFRGPTGMSVDPVTGIVDWTPEVTDQRQTPVTLQVFDSRGAISVQRFVVDVLGGNRPPVFNELPSQLQFDEGTPATFQVRAVDLDGDDLIYWSDNLPPGAAFDSTTQRFSWTPSYDASGTYPSVKFVVSDGMVQHTVGLTILVSQGRQPIELIQPADRTIREGDRIRFYLNVGADQGDVLVFGSDRLPRGATFHPTTGLFEWSPDYTQEGVYEIPLSVTNGFESKSVTATLTVTNANAVPEFVQQEGWKLYEGQTIRFNAFAFDPDNPFYSPPIRDSEGNLVDSGTYSGPSVVVEAIDLPLGASFDPVSTLFEWQPGFGEAGEYTASFQATDDGDGTGIPLTSSITVPITVLNLNRRPEITPISNQTVNRDDILDIPIDVTDADGNPVVLSAELENPSLPLPDFMMLTDNGDGTGNLRISPTTGHRGDWGITVFATDDGDGGSSAPLTGSYTFAVTVESDNEPPQWRFVGNSVAVVGQPWELTLRADDLDQEDLQFQLAGLPNASSLTPGAIYGSAMIEWTPTAADLGEHHVSVTVTDSGGIGGGAVLQDVANFTITVKGSNSSPTLDPIGNRSVHEGGLLSLQLGASDPDQDAFYFVAEGLPSGATFDANTGFFAWQTTLTDAGDYPIEFRVTDGHRSASESIVVHVNNVNQSPALVPLSEQLGREGKELRFTVTANDRDGDVLVLTAAAGLPAHADFNPHTGLFFWTPGYDQAGQHTIRFAAQDPGGLTDTIDVVVNVANVNRAPELTTSDHTLQLGVPAVFQLTAYDPDVDAQLLFSGVELPEGATVDEHSGEFRWTPGVGQAGEHLVTVEISDGIATVAQTFVIVATANPEAPNAVIELTPSFPSFPGQDVLVHVLADSLAEISSVQLTLDGQPVALDEDGRAVVQRDVPGKGRFIATVIDQDGLIGITERILKIRDPQDTAAPQVMLDELLQYAVIRETMAITGTVADSNLDVWQLELAPTNTDLYLTLASGEAAIDGSLLENFDPTAWRNGFYSLRLTARDIAGRTSEVVSQIEINTVSKVTAYARQDTDLTVDLGGIPLAVQRRYSSLAEDLDSLFGTGWSFVNRDVEVVTNVPPSGREHLGFYNALRDGTRLYVTLPEGSRVAFSFAPVAESISGREFYRPAWQADDGHGWQLGSAAALLTKSGARYYESSTGLPYNPAQAALSEIAYTLTSPDGTIFRIDADRGIVEQEFTDGGVLFFSDSGVVSSTGQAVQFVRDEMGRLVSLTGPHGTQIVYQYDARGHLASVRNLSTGDVSRYGYRADQSGRLVTVYDSRGDSQAVVYRAGQSPLVQPIRGDLGGAIQFTNEEQHGVLTEGSLHVYAFSLRDSEIQSTAGEGVLVRVEVDALGAGLNSAVPSIAGLEPLATETTGSQVVAIYSLAQENLYQLAVEGEGAGAYKLAVSIAGDVNLDGYVDGVDGELLAGGGLQYDINGDGNHDQSDTQLLLANFGFVANAAPEFSAELETPLTHQDLAVKVQLNEIASDPDGDSVYFRVTSTSNGVATLSPDGRVLTFTPAPGFAGVASVGVVADDGFNASDELVIDVNVSDAPLLSIDIVTRELRLAVGASTQLEVIGNFADQDNVPLPLDFFTADVIDDTVIALSSNGQVDGLREASTAIVISRGTLSAATNVVVGLPGDLSEIAALFLGVDAYPDTITLDVGSAKQMVVQRGDNTFVTDDDATLYISGDSSIVTVDEDGRMIAQAEGQTTITVVHLGGEETVVVRVAGPEAGPVPVDQAGGIVIAEGGYQVSIGPGALDGEAEVSVSAIEENNLPLEVPPEFLFGGAMRFDVDGAELSETVQLAAPVDESLLPGDEVYFFTDMILNDPDGNPVHKWMVMDSGVVDDDGIARTSSPPFPGLSERGNILIAKAAQPLRTVSLEMINMALFNQLAILGMAAVIAPVSPMGALVFIGVASPLAIFPIAYRATELKVWQYYADKPIEDVVIIEEGNIDHRLQVRVSDPPSGDDNPPKVTDAVFNSATGELTISGTDFSDPSSPRVGGDTLGDSAYEANVVFRMDHGEVRVVGGDFVSATATEIVLNVPPTVLLGTTEILVARPYLSGFGAARSTNWVESNEARILNPGGYGLVSNAGGGYSTVGIVDVTDIEEGADTIIRTLDVGLFVKDSLQTADRSRAYVALEGGVAVIDMVTLQQHDVDPETPDVDLIELGSGRSFRRELRVSALAVDLEERYLYAAGDDEIFVIDILPGSDTFHQVIDTIGPLGTATGLISSMTINAGGEYLFATAPATQLFAGTRSWVRGGRDPGNLLVINVNESDRPVEGASNSQLWREVVKVYPAGIEPGHLFATTDEELLTFTSRLNVQTGFGTIKIEDFNPTSFAAEVEFYDGLLDLRRKPDQKNQMNIRTPSGVVVTPDLKYAFVADWSVPLMYFWETTTASEFEDFHEVGAKVGIIEDPFGRDPKLLAATVPIPHGYAEEMEISSDSSKLYVSYLNTEEVLVFDVQKFIKTADDYAGTEAVKVGGIDAEKFESNINLPSIVVGGPARGLSLQITDPLELWEPNTTVNVYDSGGLTFKWLVDDDLLGDQPFTSQLFVSTLSAGEGLFPVDPQRERNTLFADDSTAHTLGLVDSNPDRIYRSPLVPRADGVETDDGLVFSLAFPDAIREGMIAGQDYYWGIQLKAGTKVFRESISFHSEPEDLGTPLNGVTVLTHGFQFGFSIGDEPFQQPEAFMDLGEAIAEAAGGGIVLSYNKNDGTWKDVENDVVGPGAVAMGEHLVLVADWNKESDISDSGFSEAAADALFASIVQLNEQLDNAIFASPLHFIGHSRGTVVNSEIIQRLGTYYPDVEDIHMTTLDPHDFEQKSLDVPIKTILESIKTVAIALQAYPLTAPVANRVVSFIETGMHIWDAVGVAYDPAPFSDFKDPDVMIWENVGFADNYYQTKAHASQFTLTPNGRELKVVDLGGGDMRGGADLNVNLDGRAGFTADDFSTSIISRAFGLGGPHSRVWQWYAGTTDVTMVEFADNPIFRSASDEGLSSLALGLPAFNFTDDPWYWFNPSGVNAGPSPWTRSESIWEGIGNGWYLSELGGGADARPSSGSRVPVTFDNTEVTKPTTAVPSIFNGDFENGSRMSLVRWVTGADKGRFPLSYDVPGWSYHGGEGFNIRLPSWVGGPLDIMGLFVFDRSPGGIAKDVVKKLIDAKVDEFIEWFRKAVYPRPEPPGPDDFLEYHEWYDNIWMNSENQLRVAEFDAWFDYVNGWAGEALAAGIAPTFPYQSLEDAVDKFELDPTTATAQIKDLLKKGVDWVFEKAGLKDSDFALLMGAGHSLKEMLDLATFGALDLELLDPLLDSIFQMNKVTHNRFLLPDNATDISFDIFGPWIVKTGSRIRVSMATADGNSEQVLGDVAVQQGFMSTNTYTVPIPEAFQGKVVTLSFEQLDMAGSDIVYIEPPLPGEPLPNLPGPVTPSTPGTDVVSQLYFLDNIRIGGQIRKVSPATTDAIEEGFAFQLDVVVKPADADNPGQLRVKWDDGSLDEIRALSPTEQTYTFTHTFKDEGSDFGKTYHRSVQVFVEGVNEESRTISLPVNNVGPKLVMGAFAADPGGQPSELATSEFVFSGGTFSDPGVLDSYVVEFDWGNGQTTTLDVPASNNVSHSFPEVRYAYGDDPKTVDNTYTAKLTIWDGDSDLFKQEYKLTVFNELPYLVTPSLPVASIMVGQTLDLADVFEFVDPEYGLTETWEYMINYGDGSTIAHGVPHITQRGGPGVDTRGKFGGSHTYTEPGNYTITVVIKDDDEGTGTLTYPISVVAPLLADEGDSQGNDQGVATVADVLGLIEPALVRWADAGVAADRIDPLRGVSVSVADLPGAALGVYVDGDLTIDQNAAGFGWFIDATPQSDEEFSMTDNWWELSAISQTESDGVIDLFTVVMHELGHALGLADVASDIDPTRLMTGSFSTGLRRLPSPLDFIPAGSGSSNGASQPSFDQADPPWGIVNGTFDQADPNAIDFGWNLVGDVQLVDQHVELLEDGQFFSSLSETFVVPSGVTALRFTILSSQLGATDGQPGDAFEMALLDAQTQTSVIDTVGLSDTDAAVNLQADGRVFYGSQISAAGLASSGEMMSLDYPVTFEVDMATVAAGSTVTLDFDLLGFGDRESVVVVDHVFLVGALNEAPLAADDQFVTEKGLPLTMPVLANDTDPDGQLDPASLEIVSSTANGGIVVDAATGVVTYTPHAGYAGTDAFSYVVKDDNGATSNVATVTIIVQAGPEIGSLEVAAAALEGQAVEMTVIASDPNQDTLRYDWDFGDGSDPLVDATSVVQHRFVDDGTFQVTVTVSDSGGRNATRSQTIQVSNVAPVVDAGADQQVDGGVPVKVVANFADAGEGDSHTATIDWGDGTVEGGQLDAWAQTVVGTHSYSSGGVFTVVVRVTDDEGAHGEDAVFITVEIDNVPPIVDLNGDQAGSDYATEFVAGGNSVRVAAADASISDADSPQLAFVDISLSNLVDVGDEQLVVNTTGTNIVATYDSATGQLRLEGPDTVLNFQSVLQRVRYHHTGSDATLGTRSIHVIANDGAASSNLVTSTVDVTAAARLGGFVYVDVDDDGSKDDTEWGLPNVPITLTGPVTAVAFTDMTGWYEFPALPAGAYRITETQPQAFLNGKNSLGQPAVGAMNTEGFYDVVMSPGDEMLNYNFGERGLKPELIGKHLYLASTPSRQQILEQLDVSSNGSWFGLRSGGDATLIATVDPQVKNPTIELYDTNMLPVAIGMGEGEIRVSVQQEEVYVLHVGGIDSVADFQVNYVTPNDGNRTLTNADLREDVSNDGFVSPVDALLIINLLNREGLVTDTSQFQGPPYYDVNADQIITPHDALLIINHLNRSYSPEAEGEPLIDYAPQDLLPALLPEDAASRPSERELVHGDVPETKDDPIAADLLTGEELGKIAPAMLDDRIWTELDWDDLDWDELASDALLDDLAAGLARHCVDLPVDTVLRWLRRR
jgi:YD repeat-containing protein